MTRDEAQKQIAEILKQVEQSYGCFVGGLEITRREVTGMNDDHKRYVKYVHIEFIGERWVS